MAARRRTCPFCSYAFLPAKEGLRSICPQCNRQLPDSLSEMRIPQEISLTGEEQALELEIELDPAFRKAPAAASKASAARPARQQRSRAPQASAPRPSSPSPATGIRVQVPRRPVEEIQLGERESRASQELLVRGASPSMEIYAGQAVRPAAHRGLWLALIGGGLLLAAAASTLLLMAR